MAGDTCYEIQVRKHGNWVRFGLVDSPQRAEQDARAALQERKYLEAYQIVCERRDSRSGKVNRISFTPVFREDLDSATSDQQWQSHIEGRTAPAARPPRKKAARGAYSWILPVITLLLILWGAYFTLFFVRSEIFSK